MASETKAMTAAQIASIEDLEQMENVYLNRAVAALCDLYVTYRQRFVLCSPGQGMFIPRKKDGTYVALTNAMLYNHLRGYYAIAVYAGSKCSRFVTFDVDTREPDVVHRLIAAVESCGIGREYIQVSFSGNKGYHVDILFDRVVFTDRLCVFYRYVLLKAG